MRARLLGANTPRSEGSQAPGAPRTPRSNEQALPASRGAGTAADPG